ncbi:MAG: RNA polymerase sigma-70 factor, ECF subfamily [bacterium P3]|nr:MAG: RNA polymerase sigma-70 factor, ECF subfamily [bacterium P3]KWW38704.1 MAG: RNA polymerase sigma-70 factor, ECF subfamily [bacterium F083]
MERLSTEKARRDYQLVCAARDRGDQRAYADLMQLYRTPLYMMLLKMTNSPTEADDLTIETFGKAFCSLHLYSPTHAFSTWLFSIASNNCIDHIRRRHMHTVPLSDISSRSEDDSYEYPLPADVPTPEEEVMTAQRARLLRELVAQLKPRYRKIVEMRYFDELSYEEIAEKLSLPMGTVKVQLMRARNLLASIMREQESQF